jgi:glutaconate CoA-transferase subunit B
MMKHQKRRFVEKVDYITSPGWIDGPGGRERVGLLGDRGPIAVVTEMGVMRFDRQSKRLYLAEYFPGISPEEIQANTGFELDLSRAVESVLPSAEMVDILLTQIDPQRMMV